MKNTITETQASFVCEMAGKKAELERIDRHLNQADDSNQEPRFINIWAHYGHEEEIKMHLRAAGVDLVERELDNLTPDNAYAQAVENGTARPYTFQAWDGGTVYGLALVE